MENAGEFVGVTLPCSCSPRWLIVLVNVERSTGGGPGARGQGRGSGEVKCSSLVMDNMWVEDSRRQGETLNHSISNN